jgi:biopolymer transport protein ExbB/TolQ
MRRPVVWGALFTLCFYVLIRKGIIDNPWITRYFASHPVEYIATTMFFVGMAVLWLKSRQLRREPEEPDETTDSILGEVPDGGLAIDEASTLLKRVDEQPEEYRPSYLIRRLRDALEFIERRRCVDGLEEQLRHLAEADEARSHDSYALVRIVISTIPILGFLGTVIGITRAVAELAQVVGEMSFEQAINSVVSGLSVAFDTTALALGLSIVLMFAMFYMTRKERRCLDRVDGLVAGALVGRFRVDESKPDPTVAAVGQMADNVVQKTDDLVQRQAEIWRRSIDVANERWSGMSAAVEQQIETALTRALESSLNSHADNMKQAEAEAEERANRHRQEVIGMLDKATDSLGAQYGELRRQGEVMQKTMEATERIIKLEDALNDNLNALRDANHFDETINSLAAAINLLNARLSHDRAGHVKLRTDPTDYAA